MYKILNKAINDFKSPDGKKIEFKKNFLQTSEDRELLIGVANALNINIPMTMPDQESIDWASTQSKVRTALEINWVAKPTLKTKLPNDPKIGLDIQSQTQKTTNVQEFFELYSSVNMGLYRLLPGDSQYIVEDEEIINQLINSSFADKIKIYEPTGKLIYDGVLVEHSFNAVTFDLNGKKSNETINGFKIGNLTHPKMENKVFEKVSKGLDTDQK